MTIKEGYFRVSDVIRPWTSFGHIDPATLANKARIGTNVHAKIAADHDGIFLELEEDELPYYESWQLWLKDNPIKIIQSERRMYSETYKMTGQVDAIVEVDGKKILLDYKTSAKASPGTWGIQGALYHWLCIENGEMLSDKVWFLQLAKGAKKAKIYEFTITSELMGYALGAVGAYRYFNCIKHEYNLIK